MAAPQPIVLRLGTAWGDLRGSMRALLDQRPSEAVLLSFALLSGAIWFLGRMAVLWLGPDTATTPQAELVGKVGAEFVSSVIYRTLGLYGLAALGCLLARGFGGRGSWRDSRAALFWASLVAAPVILLAHLVSLPLSGVAAAMVGSAGSVALAVAVAHTFAEAHGFRRTWVVLGVVSGLTLGLLGLVYGLTRP